MSRKGPSARGVLRSSQLASSTTTSAPASSVARRTRVVFPSPAAPLTQTTPPWPASRSSTAWPSRQQLVVPLEDRGPHPEDRPAPARRDGAGAVVPAQRWPWPVSSVTSATKR